MLKEGDQIPEFNLPAAGGKTISSDDLNGKMAVLFFYPKDDTSGCTKEAIAFSQLLESFTELGVFVAGVSPDSPESHDKFTAKHNLTVPLISDEEKEFIKAFGVWAQKNMYGRKYMGVDRSTFLISSEGKVSHIWRKVKVPGHAEKVLEQAKELAAQS